MTQALRPNAAQAVIIDLLMPPLTRAGADPLLELLADEVERAFADPRNYDGGHYELMRDHSVVAGGVFQRRPVWRSGLRLDAMCWRRPVISRHYR